MKLSEAILLGSVGTEQAYGFMAMIPNGTATCALGAALFAVGVRCDDPQTGFAEMKRLWPWTERVVDSPESLMLAERVGYPVYSRDLVVCIIWRLNDIAKWTRPQIAAWVAELEAVYDPEPVPGPVQESVAVQ